MFLLHVDVNLEAAAHLRVMVDCIKLVQQLLTGLPWPRLDLAASIHAARGASHDLYIVILARSPLDLAHLRSRKDPHLIKYAPSNPRTLATLYPQPVTNHFCGFQDSMSSSLSIPDMHRPFLPHC